MASKSLKKIIIYTDGACSGNPGAGGWGAIIRCCNQKREICGGETETTNNRMELKAAIMALKTLNHSAEVIIYTDSTYVKEGITTWIKNWKSKNWKTANRKPVKNIDLWKTLDEVANKHFVEWRWVKGHSGHPENERADELARQGINRNKA